MWIYELTIQQEDGTKQKVFTLEKKYTKQYKDNDSVDIKKKLFCRTLY